MQCSNKRFVYRWIKGRDRKWGKDKDNGEDTERQH